MAHKSAVAKAGGKALKAVGLPSDMTKWKPMDFGKAGLYGLGGAGLLGMGPMAGYLSAGGGAGGLGSLWHSPISTLKGLGQAGWDKVGGLKGLGQIGGLLGMSGGGGGLPQHSVGGTEEWGNYENAIGDYSNWINNLNNPYSDVNKANMNRHMDSIAFGGQMANRGYTAGGIDPSIANQNMNANINRGTDSFMQSILARGDMKGQHLSNMINHRLRPAETMEQQNVYNANMQASQNAQNQGNNMQLLTGLLDYFGDST